MSVTASAVSTNAPMPADALRPVVGSSSTESRDGSVCAKNTILAEACPRANSTKLTTSNLFFLLTSAWKLEMCINGLSERRATHVTKYGR